MKVFRVVFERDGQTQREPGGTSTELVRTDLRYAAATIADVWEVIEFLRADAEVTIIAVIEEHPAIVVIGG